MRPIPYTATYTVHSRPDQEDTSYTTHNRVLVRALRELLAEAGSPTLPAFLPKIGITVQACSSVADAMQIIEESNDAPHLSRPGL